MCRDRFRALFSIACEYTRLMLVTVLRGLGGGCFLDAEAPYAARIEDMVL